MMDGDDATLAVPVNARDHSEGPADAPVTLVEYGDYQCPYCGDADQVVHQLQREMGDRMRFVFRNFPLVQVHPYAEGAAEAAEAAGDQGKFWEMHDMLYSHQDALDRADLEEYAREIGLDTRRFDQALQDRKELPRVREDFESGLESGVEGTPTFFINGVRWDGPFDLDSLRQAVQQAPR